MKRSHGTFRFLEILQCLLYNVWFSPVFNVCQNICFHLLFAYSEISAIVVRGIFMEEFLTHCSRETLKRVFGKQCRPRSDAPECGI